MNDHDYSLSMQIVVIFANIIALSFTELMEKIIENNGDYWFFLQENFHSYGDAYDHIEY